MRVADVMERQGCYVKPILGKRVEHFSSRKCSVTEYFKIVLRNRHA